MRYGSGKSAAQVKSLKDKKKKLREEKQKENKKK